MSDTGIGIEPELLPRVFEIFSQADRSLDRSRGGLGMGLALVKGIVELHGGGVHAASEGPGRGAEFTVHLPLPIMGAEAPMTNRPGVQDLNPKSKIQNPKSKIWNAGPGGGRQPGRG